MALWASMKRSLKVKFYILFLQISYKITYTYYRGEKRKTPYEENCKQSYSRRFFLQKQLCKSCQYNIK